MEKPAFELLLTAIITAGVAASRQNFDPIAAGRTFNDVEISLAQTGIIGPHSDLRRDTFRTG